MKEVVIIGAGGFGKEVLFLARRSGRNVKGFLDDTPSLQGNIVMGVPILGGVANWVDYKECDFVVAIGSPLGKWKIVEELGLGHDKPSFATLIDPSAIVGEGCEVGEGAVICAGVVCTVDVLIGKHVHINLNSTVGHGTIVGDMSTVSPQVAISGGVLLGARCSIGTAASIREKLTLGDECVVGMGGVLVKNIESKSIVMGNPAKEIIR